MHWLPGPDLHDGAPPSELIYPGALPRAVLTPSQFTLPERCSVPDPGVEDNGPCWSSQGRCSAAVLRQGRFSWSRRPAVAGV